jgi:multiple sugar transport system substrate-binding protein
VHIRRAATGPLALFGIVVILGACSGSSAPTSTAAPSSGQTSQAPVSSPAGSEAAAPSVAIAPATLNYWVYEGQTDWVPIQKEGFEAAYPTIKLNVTQIPEDSYGTKLTAAVVAGDPPDVGFADRQLFKAGKNVPLDDTLKAAGVDTSTWNQRVVDTSSLDGHLYCVGSYTGAVTLFYNTEMFDAKGIPYPSASKPMSIDEYAAIARQLTDKSANVYGSTQGDPVTWLARQDFFTPDGKSVVGKINTPKMAHTYDVVSKMIQDGTSPSLSVLDPWEQGADWFSQKQVAMVITDFQSLSKMEKAGIKWRVAPVPRPDASDPPEVQAWTDCISVFADSKHQDAALAFVKWEATDGQKLRTEKLGDFPLDSKTAIETNWAGDSPGKKDFLEVFKLAGPDIFVPSMWDKVYATLFDGFGAVVDKSMTPEQMLADAEPKVQHDLDQAWKAWDATTIK